MTTTRKLVGVAATAVAVLAVAPSSTGAPRAADAPIVYATGSGGPTARPTEIFVREPDGTVRELTRTRWYEGFPTWSPDRSRIAFVGARTGDSDIYVMDADGKNVRRLAGSARRAQDLYPAWSPDGKLIAFSSNRDGAESEVYVMRADGTNLRRLTRTPGHVEDTQPRFSPDGRYLVFTSNRLGYWNHEVFRIRVSDGRGLTRLTFWGSGADGAPGDDLMPSYSRDGKRIAFVSDRGGSYGIWTMNANGKGLRFVARHRGQNIAFPRFSPDGQSLLYTTFPTAGEHGFRLRTIGVDGSGGRVLGLGSEGDW